MLSRYPRPFENKPNINDKYTISYPEPGRIPEKTAGSQNLRSAGGISERMTVSGKKYRIIRLLGHGKGGYSYLAEGDGQQVVIKQIHHEPCDYYVFGNKIEAECRDYQRLKEAKIRIPSMLAVEKETERIVKEYIEGDSIFELVRAGVSVQPYLTQVREMAAQAKACGMNIDYFPTNFIVRDGLIWYVDYECNDYMDEWNFENWGIKYWSRTQEFEEYLKQRIDDTGMLFRCY